MVTSINAVVDWQRPVKHSRTVSGKSRSEKRFAVECGLCGAVRLLKRSDALKAERNQSPCLVCSQSEKGKKGWRAVRPENHHKRAAGFQAWKLEKMSKPEKCIQGILEKFSVQYEREIVIGDDERYPFFLDFVVEGTLVIEVTSGDYYHGQPEQQRRDELKRELVERAGYRLLVIADHNMPIADFTILKALKELRDAKQSA